MTYTLLSFLSFHHILGKSALKLFLLLVYYDVQPLMLVEQNLLDASDYQELSSGLSSSRRSRVFTLRSAEDTNQERSLFKKM